jgi:hypothetical protein
MLVKIHRERLLSNRKLTGRKRIAFDSNVHKIAISSDELENVKQLNFSLQKFESDKNRGENVRAKSVGLCQKNIYSFWNKLFYFILEVASIDQ